MVNLKRLLALLIVLSVTALFFVLRQGLIERTPEEIVAMLPADVNLALEQLHYTQNEDGQRRWSVDAEAARYLKENSRAELERVRFYYYQAGTFGDLELTAKQGLLDQTGRTIDVWDDVVVTSEQGRLFSEALHYDDQQRILSSDQPVRILTPRLDLTGIGLRVDLDEQTMVVEDQVRLLYETADEVKNDK